MSIEKADSVTLVSEIGIVIRRKGERNTETIMTIAESNEFLGVLDNLATYLTHSIIHAEISNLNSLENTPSSHNPLSLHRSSNPASFSGTEAFGRNIEDSDLLLPRIDFITRLVGPVRLFFFIDSRWTCFWATRCIIGYPGRAFHNQEFLLAAGSCFDCGGKDTA